MKFSVGKSMVCACSVLALALGAVGCSPAAPSGTQEEGYEYDFTVEMPAEEGTILVMSDTQIIDSSQARGNLAASEIEKWAPDKIDDLLYKYMDDAVNTTNPSLIILLGDNVYGNFDLDFSVLDKFILKMESYGKPWTFVFGNHDLYPHLAHPTLSNEEYTEEVLKRYEAAEHCLFKRTNVAPLRYNEYTVGIKQGGKYVESLFFVDTGDGGRGGIGLSKKQCDWFETTSAQIKANYGEVPSHVYMHVALSAFSQALNAKYGDSEYFYPGVVLDDEIEGEFLEVRDGDFGRTGNTSGGGYPYSTEFFELCKGNRVTNLFAAHDHGVSFSVLYEGMRFTMGLKTGEYDNEWYKNFLGGTRVKLHDGVTDVSHVYYQRNK